MKFTVLSHACLYVESDSKSLLIDPWLLGSCYWHSWWNYPPVNPALLDSLKPDIIYLTHVHWDHFHGPTLKRFPKSTLIAIPYERSPRVQKDLESMGFSNILPLPHGKKYDIAPDFHITPYQFSSPWGDSALAIEAEGVRLLNTNDCKIMGWPLQQVLREQGEFDFAFKSHSTANDELCYEYSDREAKTVAADSNVYAESFINFMNKVAPKYAVPFASNHCHLHKDVFHFNSVITTPDEVTSLLASTSQRTNFQTEVMLSGDSWCKKNGFTIQPQDYFERREHHLDIYQKANESKLQKYYSREAKMNISIKNFERFFSNFCNDVPNFLRKRLAGKPIIFVATNEDSKQYFSIDIANRIFKEMDERDCDAGSIFYQAPVSILKQALGNNMFAHAGISKRVTYRLRHHDKKHLDFFKRLLAAYEYDVLPLTKLLSMRTAKVYCRRWRELFLYAQLLIGKIRGKSLRELETECLR